MPKILSDGEAQNLGTERFTGTFVFVCCSTTWEETGVDCGQVRCPACKRLLKVTVMAHPHHYGFIAEKIRPKKKLQLTIDGCATAVEVSPQDWYVTYPDNSRLFNVAEDEYLILVKNGSDPILVKGKKEDFEINHEEQPISKEDPGTAEADTH